MLKNTPLLLTPEMLHALASMGHGDDVALVDAHFPASRVAQQGHARLMRMPGLSVTQVLDAVLQVLPLDTFGPACAWTMEVVGDAQALPPAVIECRQSLAAQGRQDVAALERYAFYEQARQAFVIVQTGDLRTYANLLLRKGVLGHG
ncbi:MAG: RbsD/FucU family protein [Limnohabitans sp.]